jgi:hypothetical protein
MGHVANLRNMKNGKQMTFWSENLKGTDQLENHGVDGFKLLNWIKRNMMGGCRLDPYGSEQGLVNSHAPLKMLNIFTSRESSSSSRTLLRGLN